MKKIILSALAGALVMFLTIFGVAAVSVSWEQVQEPRSYVHVDYVTELTQEDCFLCGNGSGHINSHYWGEDNDLWFSEDAPAEYAIVSFAERTIRPLIKCYPWFSAGNYGIDCEFKDNGAIDLLIHYCPNRYA